jgi:hypothetical protein
MTLHQTLLDKLDERGNVLFGGVGEQRLKADMDLGIVG